MYVPSSPAELCAMLDLRPTEAQAALMDRLSRSRGIVDVDARIKSEDDFDGEALRAAMMVVLWRVLSLPGARATVLAPSIPGTLTCGGLGTVAMAFLSEVCGTRDVVLSSMTNFRDWNRIRFSGEEGWEVRLVPNAVAIVDEAVPRSLVGLVLAAGNPDQGLVASARALERVGNDPRGLVIRVW